MLKTDMEKDVQSCQNCRYAASYHCYPIKDFVCGGKYQWKGGKKLNRKDEEFWK